MVGWVPSCWREKAGESWTGIRDVFILIAVKLVERKRKVVGGTGWMVVGDNSGVLTRLQMQARKARQGRLNAVKQKRRAQCGGELITRWGIAVQGEGTLRA